MILTLPYVQVKFSICVAQILTSGLMLPLLVFPASLHAAATSTGFAMKGCPVLSLSSGPHGDPGPSAAQSVGEASTPEFAPVRMATAVQDVHW